jgi:ribosome recycling factor
LERANQVAQERMEEAIRQLRKELEELRKGQAAPAKP